MKNAQGQPQLSDKIPPSIGPAMGPRMVVMVQSPSAILRFSGGAMRNSRVCDIGIKGPPIKPCRTRNVTSMGMFTDRPHNNEQAPNPNAAVVKTLTGPKRWASQPVSGTITASAIE